MKRLSVFLFVLLGVLGAKAQDLFNVAVCTKATVNSTPIKVGDKLKKGQSVVLASGGYLALMHVSGKTMELKTVGTHKVDDLAKKMVTGDASFAEKYADFVMNSMMEGVPDDFKYDVTGSVHRGAVAPDKEILMYSPKKIVMAKSTPATLSWKRLSTTSDFVVIINDLYNNPVFKKSVSDTSLVLDFSNETRLEPGKAYFIEVKSKDGSVATDGTRKTLLELMSLENEQKVNKIASQLSSQMDKNSAIDNLLMARFYDDKCLTLNAANSLEKAVSLSPGVDEYKVMHSKYIDKECKDTYLRFKSESSN